MIPAFQPRYEGDPRQRDGAYHQGTAWPWLLGPFAEAYARVTGDREGARAMLSALQPQLTTYGVGSLAEIFDGADPQRPNGCYRAGVERGRNPARVEITQRESLTVTERKRTSWLTKRPFA